MEIRSWTDREFEEASEEKPMTPCSILNKKWESIAPRREENALYQSYELKYC